MVKKRRKLKIGNITMFLLLVMLFVLVMVYVNVDKSNGNNIVTTKVSIDDKIDSIIVMVEDSFVDKEFLNWLNDKYGVDDIYNYLLDNEYDDDIWHKYTGNSLIVLRDLYNKKYDSMSNVSIIDGNKDNVMLSFVGDVSLADNFEIMPKYDARGKGIYGILSKDVVDIMTGSDLMIANSEFTVSDRGAPLPNKFYTFRASPKRLSIYGEMGVDLVTLANNHVYDFGEDAFLDMLNAFDEYNIPYVGAGHNIEEAKRPYYFIINGYKIAFVNATRAEKYILTPGALENSSGVFRCYDPSMFIDVIREAKNDSDYVISLIHWGKEDSHWLEDVQVETAKLYIDAGSDIIIGSHAHVLQGIDFYNDKPIIYNLGDFIFNNESKETAIFQMKLSYDGDMEYYIIPGYQEGEYTKLLEGDDKKEVINNIISWSNNKIFIDEDGKISKAIN